MKDKDFVKQVCPKAKAERHKTNGNKTYWLIRNDNAFMWMASGDTEKLAWQDAKKRLELITK